MVKQYSTAIASTNLSEDHLATLDDVSIDIAVVLGKTAMPIHQVLRLGRGAIIELDSSEEDEVRILANNMPVARGTVIVSGNRIAVEVKQLSAALARTRPEPLRDRGPCPAQSLAVTSARSHAVSGARPPHMRSWRNW